MKFLYGLLFIILFYGFYLFSNFLFNNNIISLDNYINYVFFSKKEVDYKKYDLKNIVIVGIDEKFINKINKTPYNINSYEYINFIKKILGYNPKIMVVPDILDINILKTNLGVENNIIRKINISKINKLIKLNKKNNLLLGYNNYNYNIKNILEKKGINFGYVGYFKKDGLFYTKNTYILNGKIQVPLSHKLYYFLNNKNTNNYVYSIKDNKLEIQEKNINSIFKEIPLESKKSIITPLININNIKYISLYDLYKNKNINLKDKIIFFGYNFNSEKNNLFYMGFKNKIWYVLNNYLSFKNDIYYNNIDKKYLFYMILFPVILIILILIFLKNNLFALIINVIFILFYVYLYYYLINSIGVILPIGTLTIILLTLLSIILLLWAFSSYIKRKYIHNMFDKYVGEEVLEKKEESRNLNISQKKDIFILFTDIESFTSISEKLENPEKVINMLNIYFKYMNEAIEKNNGFIDKYVGDAIIAFWEKENYADNILKHIIYMKEIHTKINKEIDEKINKDIKLKTRFGLHYGEVILGDVGDENSKISYTAIGDNVNLASRLEGINKYYGTNIIISETVLEKLKYKSNFIIRLLDKIKVKGKNEGIKIYEVIGYEKGENIEKVKYYREYEKGIYYYLNGNFNNAISILLELKNTSLGKEDKTLSIMLDRIKLLKENPPKNWNGIWTFNTK